MRIPLSLISFSNEEEHKLQASIPAEGSIMIEAIQVVLDVDEDLCDLLKNSG